MSAILAAVEISGQIALRGIIRHHSLMGTLELKSISAGSGWHAVSFFVYQWTYRLPSPHSMLRINDLTQKLRTVL
jgi:hypothetical protein